MLRYVVWLLISVCFSELHAQQLRGIVYELGTDRTIAQVEITNIRSRQSVYSDREGKFAIAANKNDCDQLDGMWVDQTDGDESFCVIPTHDEGKKCSDHSECESVCFAKNELRIGEEAVGQCYGSFYTKGTCLLRVANGRVESRLCID